MKFENSNSKQIDENVMSTQFNVLLYEVSIQNYQPQYFFFFQ